MSIQMTPAEIKAGGIWINYFSKMISVLETQKKINPNHVKDMKNYFRIFNFANQSALHINKFDVIVRDSKKRDDFLGKNITFDSDLLDEIWFAMLIVSTLRFYWSIELSLISLLKDVQYGKNGFVVGKENLGRLKAILDGLECSRYIDWSAIDITFRNALAHGWYYWKKQNFVYYTNAKLTKGKLLTRNKLLLKCKAIQIYAIVFAGLVGNWIELEDFGSKDPLRKSKPKHD